MITSIPKMTNIGNSIGPNDIVESLTRRRHLSWSQLYGYRSCPRKWFFSHVEGVQPEFVSAALVFGSAIHSSAQHHYEQALAGVTTTPVELVEVYRQAWTGRATRPEHPHKVQQDRE